MGRAAASPGPSRSARSSATASRWASSTLPPYLNLAFTSVTTSRRPRICPSLAPCSLGSTDVDLRLEHLQLPAEHLGHAVGVVDHLGPSGELHGAVVGGGHADAGVLVRRSPSRTTARTPSRRPRSAPPTGSRRWRPRSGWVGPGATRRRRRRARTGSGPRPAPHGRGRRRRGARSPGRGGTSSTRRHRSRRPSGARAWPQYGGGIRGR